MTSTKLVISIITVCKNSAAYIAETIQSVFIQTYPHIEYIIIDGQSTDGTLDIISQYKTRISHLLSEPDNGMYDAINKGLSKATGDYFMVLNSDDVLVQSNTIEQVSNAIGKERKDWYYGDMIKLKNGKKKNVKLFQVTFKQLLLSTHSTFAPHPCFFCSRLLHHKLGGYNLEYRFASDYDYILRALSKSHNHGSHLDIYITQFRMHEKSITASGKITKERVEILREHGYYEYSVLTRKFFYYILWIYYKILNIGNRFRRG